MRPSHRGLISTHSQGFLGPGPISFCSPPQAWGPEQQDLLPHDSGGRRSEIKQTEGQPFRRTVREVYLPGLSPSSGSLLAVSGTLWLVDPLPWFLLWHSCAVFPVCMCGLSSHQSYGIRPTLWSHFNLIISVKTSDQDKSHSEVLGVSNSTCDFWGRQCNPYSIHKWSAFKSLNQGLFSV